MTVIGAHVLTPWLGVAWADSEVYSEAGAPVGHRTKLVVNPAGFTFAFAGWSEVARQGGSAASEAASLAHALRLLPNVLRRASERCADRVRDPSHYGGQHGALIGFDPDAGSVIAYRFSALECFRAVRDHRQTAPSPSGSDSFLVACHQSAIALAAQQLAVLQQHYPDTTGGTLSVALIRPDGVQAGPVWDFAANAKSAHLVGFPPADAAGEQIDPVAPMLKLVK